MPDKKKITKEDLTKNKVLNNKQEIRPVLRKPMINTVLERKHNGDIANRFGGKSPGTEKPCTIGSNFKIETKPRQIKPNISKVCTRKPNGIRSVASRLAGRGKRLAGRGRRLAGRGVGRGKKRAGRGKKRAGRALFSRTLGVSNDKSFNAW